MLSWLWCRVVLDLGDGAKLNVFNIGRDGRLATCRPEDELSEPVDPDGSEVKTRSVAGVVTSTGTHVTPAAACETPKIRIRDAIR